MEEDAEMTRVAEWDRKAADAAYREQIARAQEQQAALQARPASGVPLHRADDAINWLLTFPFLEN